MENNKDSIQWQIEGMTCTNCALGIQKMLEKKGASQVAVNYTTGDLSFHNDAHIPLEKLASDIEAMGYEVVLPKEENDAELSHGHQHDHSTKWGKLEKMFIVSAIFTIPLILAMFVPLSFLHQPAVQFALSLPVMLIGMYHFGRSAWSSIKIGVPNMDVLIIIGSSAAFFYSIYGWLNHLGHQYMFFETAASIITLVLLGNVIEKYAVSQTTSALQDLAKLQVDFANRIDENGHIEKIMVKKLHVGDILQVNSGEAVPTDGVIIKGIASINEAMISGETLPKAKDIGEKVIGGTILVEGNMQMKVTELGKDTTLANIIAQVKAAQQLKPNIQKLADTISAYFVPTVLSIAALVFLVEYFVVHWTFQTSMLNAIAVLVIACPCAMGLATPTAVAVGLGRAAKMGILYKGGNTFEVLAKLQNIVFDKTGTLTTGNFKVASYETSLDEENFKAIIAGLEKHSSHSLAESLRENFAETTALQLQNVQEIAGKGIIGTSTEGTEYALGNNKLYPQTQVPTQKDLYLFENGKYVGSVNVKDELKNDAKTTIQYFKNKNIDTYIMSGDNSQKTNDTADALQIAHRNAGLLPEEKLAAIHALSSKDVTAMVGDGINDAPALTAATVGISLGDATQVAIQSAEVILLKGKLADLVSAHQLSLRTVATIKQNLFWAFFYNVMAIPLAALGFLNPMIAAFTMAFSDVIVIGNSLRLRYKKLK